MHDSDATTLPDLIRNMEQRYYGACRCGTPHGRGLPLHLDLKIRARHIIDVSLDIRCRAVSLTDAMCIIVMSVDGVNWLTSVEHHVMHASPRLCLRQRKQVPVKQPVSR